MANSNASRKIDIGRVTDAYKACRDGLFEDVKIAKKMQVVLDIVRKGITWTPQNRGGMQETMPLYEVSCVIFLNAFSFRTSRQLFF